MFAYVLNSKFNQLCHLLSNQLKTRQKFRPGVIITFTVHFQFNFLNNILSIGQQWCSISKITDKFIIHISEHALITRMSLFYGSLKLEPPLLSRSRLIFGLIS